MNTQLKQSQSNRRMFTRSAALAGLLLSMAGASFAQEAARPAPREDRGAINVPCCDPCGKGGSTIVDLSTGVAPWTSPQGAITPIGVTPGWKNPNPPSRWINTGSQNPGSYTYNLKINVPKNCSVAPKVSFAGTGWGDNAIVIKLNDKELGKTAVSSGGKDNYGFRDPYGVAVNGTMNPGQNMLSVTVRNDEAQTGFLFDGKLRIECPQAGGNIYTNGTGPQY